MATITEIIPSLGSVPTTADPSTFDERGDTLLGTALPAFRTSVNTLATQANALAAGLNSVAAGGAMTIPYTFSTTTTDSDQGAGILRLENATQNAATTIRADLSGSDASVWTDVLNTFDDSTSAIKGHILLQATGDATNWLLFSVSALASPSGYKNITVANVGSSAASPFANNDALVLKFSRNGDKGDIGASGGLPLGTPVSTTSGTAIDFTGIPSGTKVIVVSLAGVSTSDTSPLRFQLGDSGGVETAGYVCEGVTLQNDVAAVIYSASSTSGADEAIGVSAALRGGTVTFMLENSATNTWAVDAHYCYANYVTSIGGHKALSAVLDRVRITTVSGSATFDAGEINIAYQ